MTNRRALVLLIVALFSTAATDAGAYSIGSGITTSCHEVVSYQGLVDLIVAADISKVELPADPIWRRVAKPLAETLRAVNPSAPPPAEFSEQQLFLLWSVVVGVRSPDVEGHSVSDMATLRLLQADPSADGQHLHALRGTADDFLQGDVAAIEGTKQILRDGLNDARALQNEPSIIQVPFYLDFYGNMQVDVARLPYLLGRAAHTLQDSYAHMLRSDDGRIVYHVSNYLDAIAGTLDESRDGMAHSNSFDDCTGPIGTLTKGASDATLGFALAARAYLAGDPTLVEKGLTPCDPSETDLKTCGWMTYNPSCAAAIAASNPAEEDEVCCTGTNAYCESTWLPIFRERQSKPYLEEIFSCSTSPGARGNGAAGLFIAFGLAAFAARRRRRIMAVAPIAISVAVWPTFARAAEIPAGAEPPEQRSSSNDERRAEKPIFVALEGHASLLSDAPDNSIINATIGYAVRGGYRWKQWGVLGHIERNYWLPTQFSSSLQPGALNIGVGGEFRYAGGFVRSSVTAGPSILMFDTALHDKGRVGIFLDLRPLGFRYRVLDNFVIALDPLTIAYVQPVMGDTNVIRQVEYRTLLALEADF